ncbi:MAG TPA: site-2 protease family protein [Verrucomicrobiales bacterium]|nr:site-2 protease family protein [Verrucomicrobiales bacterium]
MDAADLANIVALWMCLVVLLSFHEYAHAWMAHKCGDDTARMMGRMTINPIVHIDPIGTVFLPLMMLSLNPGFALFGWAKPVPVNPSNLSNRKRDDILISMAGPAMNVILAIVILAVLRLAIEMPEGISKSAIVAELPKIAFISMFLCLFNLIPVPPLDGSHVMRHVVGMSEETYRNIARFGFIIVLVVINIPGVISFIADINEKFMVTTMTLLMFPT